MGKSIGVTQMLGKKYAATEMPQKWHEALGDISKPFRWLVFGNPKHGKTSFLLQFCKDMALTGNKVFYNSMEEGDSKTMQAAMIRVGMSEVTNGKFILGDRDTLPEMIEKLRKNKAAIVVIDSRDYMNMSTSDYKKITTLFPRKSFVIVCWEQSKKPLGKYAKDMAFMVDMITHVEDHIATTNGRFGANLKFDIWPGKDRRASLMQGGLGI